MNERDPRQIEMFHEEEMGHTFPGLNMESLSRKYGYPGEQPLFSPTGRTPCDRPNFSAKPKTA